MPRAPFLHELEECPDLFRIVSDEKSIIPQLVEKDYWIMHCLYGLSLQGFNYELKGGTSLSKGYGIIHRFSEDIDIRIDTACAPFDVSIGKNHTKAKHIQSRKHFYDWLANEIAIDGIVSIERDESFDDDKYRSGGIRLIYESHFEELTDLKEGILLELGFDDTTPNSSLTISSWASDKAKKSDVKYHDNQAKDVKCYHPGYTFVEKLQTVSAKFRQQQESDNFPANFMRHYYDISQLLDNNQVQQFIGTTQYNQRKKERFRQADNLNIAENEAFLLSIHETRDLYRQAFESTQALYYDGNPTFDDILNKIQSQIDSL